jgi:LmbE family N-acetylglucosaminyl deacetylase
VAAIEDLLGPRRPGRVDVLVPDGVPLTEALRRTTVLAVGAHPDDLELGGAWGIVTCVGRPDRWFTGVTCTDGAGSARGSGDTIGAAELVARRREEQRTAARIGAYGLQVQLGHPSAEVRDIASREVLIEELAALLDATRPRVVLGHDLLDRHSTHVAVGLATVEACRRLDPSSRPQRFLGVEGWRSLDWLVPADRVRLDVSGHDELLQRLLECFPTQLEGKRYDRAGAGRRRGNATFDDERAFDTAEQVAFAVDLTPLIEDDRLSVDRFTTDLLDRARSESLATLRSVLGVEG